MTTHTRQRRLKLTYSNVIATVALFLAIGGAGALAATHLGRNTVGAAQLKANAVTGAKVKDGSLTGADVVASSLGKVPNAGHADSAANADHAARADSATRADSAGHADTATLATTATGLTEPEPVHYLNEPGEPGTASVEVITPVGFYRDREGVVHLQGRVAPTTELGALVAALPPAFRPAQNEVFDGVATKEAPRVWVYAEGAIEILGAAKGETVSLAGITWRVAPPGFKAQ